MGKKSTQMGLWLYFLLFLHASKGSTRNISTNCPADKMKIICNEGGKNHNPYCSHKISQHCDEDTAEVPTHCYDTLDQVKDNDVCTVKKPKGLCGSLKPNHIKSPGLSLVELHLYYHHSGWGHEGLLNITLPAPTWKKLQLQFVDKSGPKSKCRNFTLTEPVNGTLMYDCHIQQKFGKETTDMELIAQSDSGEGAYYLFRIPPGLKVDPKVTCPSDWHIFFYIHQEAIQRHEPLPVTVQSAPYGQVNYSIVLARCLDKECSEFEEADYQLKTKDTKDDLWTIYLSRVTSGGNYIVRVQIVSDWCLKTNGCYVSESPIFEISSSSTWIVLLITTTLILLLIVIILIMFYQRRKSNMDFFRALKNKQPTVLLVYHPESQAAFDFVNIFAEFLRKTCCVADLMADKAVGSKDPTNWTKIHMKEANRVLFIIPKDSGTQCVTPIRNQWKEALNHCISHQFITNQEHAKQLAILVNPTSGDVPCQISDIRRFKLSHNPTALVNWLHGGSFLDQIFLWLPHIRSSTKKNITPTWRDVVSAAQKMGSLLTTPNFDSTQIAPIQNRVEFKQDVNDAEFSEWDSNDSSNGLAFDLEIPDVNDKVYEPCQMSNLSLENSSDENDIFP